MLPETMSLSTFALYESNDKPPVHLVFNRCPAELLSDSRNRDRHRFILR
jgi:hypothetical protein